MDSVKAQMARKQYLAAFETIATVEKGFQEFIPVLTELLLDHRESVTTTYDKWTLRNHAGNGQERTGTFDVVLEDLLTEAIDMFPNDCAIYASLAKYYAFVFDSKHLFLPLDGIRNVKNLLEKKVPANCTDYQYYYVIGYANNYLGTPTSAMGSLQKAISANQKYAPAYLELANSYRLTRDYQSAIKHAKKAFELSTDRIIKSRAALLMGDVYEALNDNNAAIANYRLADSTKRKEFFNQLALVNIYVKTNSPNIPDAIKAFLGANGRDDLHNYIDIFEIYAKYNRLPDLAIYCQKALADNAHRSDIQACLNFTLGLVYKNINLETAKQHFRKAKEQGIIPGRYSITRAHPNTLPAVEEAFKLIK